MDIKLFIRQYEQLKNQKPGSIREQISLEREWQNLHVAMTKAKRHTAKKRKAELQAFMVKTEKVRTELSLEVFSVLTGEKKEVFNRFLKSNSSTYAKEGAAGLVTLYLKTIRSPKTFEECVDDKEKKEQVLQMTANEWEEKVLQMLRTEYQSLEEAYQREREAVQLVYWWKKTHKKQSLENWTELRRDLNLFQLQLANYMLGQMGYRFTIDPYVKEKTYASALYQKGLLFTIQLLEEDGIHLPMVEEILNHISFIHPREEFTEVRSMKRHFVIHAGPTNSGKTYHAIEALKKSKTGVYLAPIRLLALEIQEKLNRSGVPCHLMTGENILYEEGAKHRSSTIEMASFQMETDTAVIDEAQMIEDPKRGSAWLRAIFGLKAKEVHICGAPHAIPFLVQLIEECGDTYEIVMYKRQTNLILEEEPFSFPSSVRPGDALIVFSKTRVLEIGKALQNAGIKASLIYGKLPAEARKKQVDLFSKRETQVVVSTDAIGIGLNLPIKRVVFLETAKYDGIAARPLTPQEVKQIAGRAGRRGMYETGYVNTLVNKEDIRDKLEKPEQVITKSVIAPTDRLTEISIGTLRQRLLAWREADLQVDYLEKANIDEQLTLLKQIEKWEYEIEPAQLFKALYIPFDSKVRELVYQWITYVRALKDEKTEMTKPVFSGSSLKQLETYYHQINLYENFCRKFNLPSSKQWIRQEKEQVIRKINRTIRQNQMRNVPFSSSN